MKADHYYYIKLVACASSCYFKRGKWARLPVVYGYFVEFHEYIFKHIVCLICTNFWIHWTPCIFHVFNNFMHFSNICWFMKRTEIHLQTRINCNVPFVNCVFTGTECIVAIPCSIAWGGSVLYAILKDSWCLLFVGKTRKYECILSWQISFSFPDIVSLSKTFVGFSLVLLIEILADKWFALKKIFISYAHLQSRVIEN